MKKFFIACLLSISVYSIQAQVKIGGAPTNPHASAVLELDGGNNRGLLLPRMRKIDMLAIPSPAEGLTVYLTDEQATYLRRSGDWVKLSGAADAFSLPYAGTFNEGIAPVLSLANSTNGGTGIYGASTLGAGTGVHGYVFNGGGYGIKGTGIFGRGGYFNSRNSYALITDTGRVGFGTLSPAGFIEVDASGNDATNTLVINDDVNPTIQIQKASVNKGYIQADNNGNDIILATNVTNATGKVVLRTASVDRLMVDNNGLVGIGNPAVGAKLYVDATGTSATTMLLNDQSPAIHFQNSGVNKSFIKQEGNNLVLRPMDQNFSGKVILQAYNDGGWMFVDADGNSSFGQDPATFNGTPNDVRVHIKGNSSNVLALEAPVGSSGPKLSFIDRTNNVINNMGSIRSDNDAMTFGHKNSKYEWGTDMILKHDPGLFSISELSVAGFIGTGTGFLFTPEAPLHVHDILGVANTMILDALNPTINFKANSVEKAFIQQTGNDLKIGTYTTNDPGRFIVRTNGADRLWIDSVGYVTIGGKIGPTLSGPYKLAVKGKIAATDFNVIASGSWPDYVFDPSYKLKTLEETEAFIKSNKHLPNIPAASVVEKEGIALGDMQKRMMEKIEELTLYLIEANKQIKDLNKKIVEIQTIK